MNLHPLSRSNGIKHIPEPKNRQENKWPLWMKVAAVAAAGFAVGGLVMMGRNPADRDPKMCDLNEGAVSTNSCVPKNMLNFFNNYFPNVVVIGADSEAGKETLKWLDHLGVEYTSQNTYDKSTVPFNVWSRIQEYSVKDPAKVLDALNHNRPLTPEEQVALDRWRGAAACVLNHRRAVLDTIRKYREAEKKLAELKSEPDSSSEKIHWKAELKRYSSVFVFEHNARFGTVRDDGSAALSQETAQDLEKVVKALPDDWEYFSLFSFDYDRRIDRRSKDFPGAQSLSEQDVLVHPSSNGGAKAYAWSHRSYSDLERLFLEIREDGVERSYYPSDNEFYALSERQEKEGRRGHLSAALSLVYRAKSPSFHEKAFENKHCPSTRYHSLKGVYHVSGC